MRPAKRWMPALAITAMLACVAFTYAKERNELGAHKLLTTISIRGFGNGFDISWADSEAGRYYLEDRGNASATPSGSSSVSCRVLTTLMRGGTSCGDISA